MFNKTTKLHQEFISKLIFKQLLMEEKIDEMMKVLEKFAELEEKVKALENKLQILQHEHNYRSQPKPSIKVYPKGDL